MAVYQSLETVLDTPEACSITVISRAELDKMVNNRAGYQIQRDRLTWDQREARKRERKRRG